MVLEEHELSFWQQVASNCQHLLFAVCWKSAFLFCMHICMVKEQVIRRKWAVALPRVTCTAGLISTLFCTCWIFHCRTTRLGHVGLVQPVLRYFVQDVTVCKFHFLDMCLISSVQSVMNCKYTHTVIPWQTFCCNCLFQQVMMLQSSKKYCALNRVIDVNGITIILNRVWCCVYRHKWISVICINNDSSACCSVTFMMSYWWQDTKNGSPII